MSNDVARYLGEQAKADFGFNTCTVSEDILLGIFNSLKKLFYKTKTSKSVLFGFKDGDLIVAASIPSAGYLTRIPVGAQHDCQLCCRFIDISELLTKRGECTITISPACVLIYSTIATATLPECVESVSIPDVESGYYSPIKHDVVGSGLSRLLSMNAYANVFGSSASITMCGAFMQIRYPTLWAQVPCDELETVIDIATATVISYFMVTEDKVYFALLGNAIVLRRANEWLIVSRTPPSGVNNLKAEMKTSSYLGTVNVRGFKTALKALQKSVDSGGCDVTLFTDGVQVHSQRDTASVNVSIGGSTDKLVDFTIDIGMLINIIGIAGDSFDVSKRGDAICLVSKSSVVFSCQG